jgi:hypothetical protein
MGTPFLSYSSMVRGIGSGDRMGGEAARVADFGRVMKRRPAAVLEAEIAQHQPSNGRPTPTGLATRRRAT